MSDRPEEIATLFVEDTIVFKNDPERMGVISASWHEVELEPEDDLSDIVRAEGVPAKVHRDYVKTGQLPKHYHILNYVEPTDCTILAHEAQLQLVDRAFAFGDRVKRDAKDTMSGIVINTGADLQLQHCYGDDLEEFYPNAPKLETIADISNNANIDSTSSQESEKKPLSRASSVLTEKCRAAPKRQKKADIQEEEDKNSKSVRDVPDDEVVLAADYEEEDLVIWKNCWIGSVEQVAVNVAVRLSNGSVVIPEDSRKLSVPIPLRNSEIIEATDGTESHEKSMGSSDSAAATMKQNLRGVTDWSRCRAVLVSNYCVGQQVVTQKGNLRRGSWLYGAYDPNIPPVGFIVEVRTGRLTVNWICQNFMVHGRYEPVPRPDRWLSGHELDDIKRFRKSARGVNTIMTGPHVCAPGGYAVGDRVRFRDLKAATLKYDGRTVERGGLGKGKVLKIPREKSLGFDVNTFVVERTRTWAEVFWQDCTTTREWTTGLVPFENSDENEVWPGEIVTIKTTEEIGHEISASNAPFSVTAIHEDGTTTAAENNASEDDFFVDTIISDLPDVPLTRTLGVVQSVDSKERIARVKWFKDPQLHIHIGFTSGSYTGELEEAEEEVSLYDIVAREELNLSLGDFVLVRTKWRPSVIEDGQQDQSLASFMTSLPSATLDNMTANPNQPPPALMDALRNLRDMGLLGSLSLSLARSPNPQLRIIANFISMVEDQALAHHGPPPPTDPSAFVGKPMDWIGEVIEKGIDGMVTIRLGGLDAVKDIRVPIEGLYLVLHGSGRAFNGYDDETETEDEGWDDSEYGSEDSDDDDSEDYNMDWRDMDDFEEEVSYEGGARLPDDGGDNAWFTDSDSDGDDIDMFSDTDEGLGPDPEIVQDEGELPLEGEYNGPCEPEQEQNPNLIPLPATSSLSTSETIAAPENPNSRPRFIVLDTPVPEDHYFLNDNPPNLTPSLLRRITKEHKVLSTSLPPGVFLRTFESRLDLIRVIIFGPLNTPYEMAPFMFDFAIPSSYPRDPPEARFHSWTNGMGKINPNLNEDGKVCLSLLGTWPAQDKCEGWTTDSSILQLVLSLMALVLNKDPYYNEAGFGVLEGSKESKVAAEHYGEKAYILARGFIRRVLVQGASGLEEEVRGVYLGGGEGGGLLGKVVEEMRGVVERSQRARDEAIGGKGKAKEVSAGGEDGNQDEVGEQRRKVSAGGLVLLKRELMALEKILENNTATVKISKTGTTTTIVGTSSTVPTEKDEAVEEIRLNDDVMLL